MRPSLQIYRGFLLLFAFISQESRVWGGSGLLDNGSIRFEHLTIEDGLSNNFIRVIYQDRLGFIWIGTQNGLNRYDGYDIEVFEPIPGDANSLSNVKIMALLEDRAGTLWVGTGDGLNRFDRELEQFQRFLPSPGKAGSLNAGLITALAQTDADSLWVGTSAGLHRMNLAGESFSPLEPQSPQGEQSKSIKALLADPAGYLWVGSSEGLWRLDLQDNSLTTIELTSGTGGDEPEISVLFRGSRHHLWVGTIGAGLIRIDGVTGAISRFHSDTHPGIADNISGITQDRHGTLWITTLRGITHTGLHRFDPEQESFIRFYSDPDNPFSLTWSYATAVLMDRSGVLWAGTSRGLNKVDIHGRKFPVYRQHPGDNYNIFDNVYGLLLDDEDRLWMGLDMPALVILDRQTGSYDMHTWGNTDIYNPNGSGIYHLIKDPQGRMWIGVAEYGLVLFDPRSRTSTLYPHKAGDPNSLSSNYITYLHPAIHGEARGKLWVATNAGLNLFDPDTGRFRIFHHDPDDPDSLSGNRLTTLLAEDNGLLWVGTGITGQDLYTAGAAGLNRFHPESGTNRVFAHDPNQPGTLSNNNINDIHRDSKGRLWVATEQGLNLLKEPETGRFTSYFTDHGLPNNSIVQILEDQSGMLWLSTLKGLSRFDPERGEFRNYDVDDGVQGARFNANSAFKSQTGELFLGGTNGVNAFFPADIQNASKPPPVVITALFINNQPAQIGEQEPLQKHISLTHAMTLKHHQNDLAFTFSALNYSRPQRNRYRFYLAGYDGDWREPGPMRRAVYTNLDPGEYTFRVQGANKDGVWNRAGAEVAFRIRPPWWQSWWAYGLYILMAGLCLHLVVLGQMVRTRRKLEAQAQIERHAAQAREAELARVAAEAQARAVAADNERKTHELERARDLQLSMLPAELPVLPQLEVGAILETATEVGGDYYDFREQDGRLIAAIGDATGHGLEAGTVVTATKGLFNAFAGENELHQILEHISNALRLMGFRSMFMGLTLVRLQAMRLEVASAGMPFPLLYRSNAQAVEVLELRGTPLGSPPSLASFSSESTQVEPGDVLLCMSDGLQERFNPDRQMLGQRAIVEEFRRLAPGSPNEILRGLVDLGERWGEGRPADDDLTLVVFRIR